MRTKGRMWSCGFIEMSLVLSSSAEDMQTKDNLMFQEMQTKQGFSNDSNATRMGDFISQCQAMIARWRQASPGLEGSR